MMAAAAAIQRIGVAIPAQDEQDLLPACLAALDRAAARCPLPVAVMVVADACRDATAQVARAGGAGAIEVDHRCVGRARAEGMAALLEQLGAEGTWLASTDADSLVPEHWLTRQLELAAGGADAVAGTVRVADWGEHPARARRRYARLYRPSDGHRHVHGANLAVSAEAYVAVGGFAPLPVHEDVALVAALDAGGYRVARSGQLSVLTSARAAGRAPGGFAGYLRSLAASDPVGPGPGR